MEGRKRIRRGGGYWTMTHYVLKIIAEHIILIYLNFILISFELPSSGEYSIVFPQCHMTNAPSEHSDSDISTLSLL